MAGTLRICTPGGQELELPFSGSDTVAKLKDDILGRMDEPVAHLRLLHGAEELKNEWVLSEHGITDGTLLTQVISAFPSGMFKLFSGGRANSDAPAGRNTSAEVEAEFRSDGTFHIRVHETEITSLVRGKDWDPYEWKAAFDHDYEGKARIEQLPEILLLVSRCTRKGIFKEPEPVELMGEIFPDAEEVKLKLPFEAGACNEGRAGFRWVTVSQNEPKEDPVDDSSGPDDEADEAEPPLEDQLAAAKSGLKSTQAKKRRADLKHSDISEQYSNIEQELRESTDVESGGLPCPVCRAVIPSKRLPKRNSAPTSGGGEETRSSVGALPADLLRQVRKLQEQHTAILARRRQKEEAEAQAAEARAAAEAAAEQQKTWSDSAAWRGPSEAGAQDWGRADWTDWTQSNATRFGKGKGKGKVQSSNSGYDSHAQEGQSRNRWGRRSGGAHG
ncbi:unnamed protein product [Symbiodinium sp. CCMP2592]|nr:unnamed protein product [Symbiodinium sp. CCMP2592]